MNWVPIADALVWARVMRPPIPLVYLDLNHFIYLAKTNVGIDAAPNGYPELLKAATDAVREKRALFPLSSEHIFELTAIKDPKQRKHIADVMEALSGFGYLLGRPEIARLEIEAGIEDLLGEPSRLPPIPLIGRSFGWAFGMVGGMKIIDADGNDASISARREMGIDKYEAFMRFANYTIERAMLDGPPDDELPALRENGYDPEAVRGEQASRLAFELDLSARLDDNPKWRRGRLRDVVSAREISHEWLDVINDTTKQRVRAGRPLFDPSDDDMRRFMAAMPHTQVAVSMKTRYHRDPTHRWTTNDITDIDAMSVAYAYCDAVFTDKAARSALANSKELRVLGTFLPRTANELADWLSQQPRRAIADLLVPHPLRSRPTRT
jgi:hypothetical protein